MPDPSTRAQHAHEVRTRLSSLQLSPTREAEIVDELSQHLDDRYRELIAGGASPDEARRLTLAEFRSGNLLAQQWRRCGRRTRRRQSRRARQPGTCSAISGRTCATPRASFWKQPAFAAATVLTLALGIGATTAIFSVVYGVLLKPLPFHEPDRLVSVRQHAPHGAGTNQGPATYFTYRENQTAFEAIGAWDPTEVSITGGGDPERVQALLVSADTLPLLRVQPIVGRVFSDEDDTPGNPLRVLLTHGYWQRRFGGAESVVGQSLVIDGRPGEMIGVLPPRSSSSALLRHPAAAATGRQRTARTQFRVSGARPAEARRHAGQANADVAG